MPKKTKRCEKCGMVLDPKHKHKKGEPSLCKGCERSFKQMIKEFFKGKKKKISDMDEETAKDMRV